MEERSAVVAGQFYPSHEKTCRGHIDECLGTAKKLELGGRVVAGIVPHAGWTYSGPTAAKVFAQIERKTPPPVFILFGAVHRGGIKEPSLYSSGSWETPMGTLPIDKKLAARILEEGKGLIADNASAHAGEHSIEVQLPFIAYLFPGTTIVPIALPPNAKAAEAGNIVGTLIEKEKIDAIIIGTTDLTHYGPGYGFAPKGTGEESVKWVKEVNDASIIKLAVDMDIDRIVSEAQQNHNACGAGAMAATAAAARAMGAKKGTLVEYTTSLDAVPFRKVSDFVGYAGIVYTVE
jgi:AmmeMemoRadiSam system protein B